SRALAVTRKPGVQIPHCNAAPSRKHCCSGWRCPSQAIPSTVPMLAPSASTASTRQLFTGTPLSSTVQAPQLPLLQPSLAPVSLRVSRRTSSKLSRGSQRNCAGSLLTVVDTCDFLATGFAYSFGLVSCNLCGAGFQPA